MMPSCSALVISRGGGSPLRCAASRSTANAYDVHGTDQRLAEHGREPVAHRSPATGADNNGPSPRIIAGRGDRPPASATTPSSTCCVPRPDPGRAGQQQNRFRIMPAPM